MLDSDADRLEIIKSLGGQLLPVSGGEFWAIFDRDFSEVLGGPSVETRQPFLECRTSDVLALGLDKEIDISVGNLPYRVRRHEPDGTGMSRLILKRA